MVIVIHGPDTLEQARALQKARKAVLILIPHEDEDLLLDDIVALVPRFAEVIVARTLPDAFELL